MTEVRSRLPNFGQSPFLKKGTRDPKTIILMVWVPSTKVHDAFVLSKHVHHKFFTLIKLWEIEKVREITVPYKVLYMRQERLNAK